ncbi:MAG TPA: glycosyltransferase family protein [candidate division Zixibacteria bacterium]|nr:glycosyltransferase family protein [candidate division Zixibacteria bacterium]
MKILYGINTNGQGHINRARIFIDKLQNDGHEVHILFVGKEPPAYAYELAPVSYYKFGPIDIYNDHKLDYSKTFQVLLTNLGKMTKNRRDILDVASKEDFDVIFTDFENMTSVIGRVLKKPTICIDHQHSAFHPSSEEAPAKPALKLGLKFGIRLMVPYYSHCFAIDFTEKIDRVDDFTLFPLIWKPEFDNYKITTSNHYLVYLARYDKDKMIKNLLAFPDDTFIIYGFNTEEVIKNIIFKKTSREEFLKDIVACKAIIANAGFSLAWEACLLNKMIWVIPHSNNYEQITNAYRLNKLDRAFVTDKLTENEIKYFLSHTEKQNYQPKVKLPIISPDVLMDQVYSQIKFFQEK